MIQVPLNLKHGLVWGIFWYPFYYIYFQLKSANSIKLFKENSLIPKIQKVHICSELYFQTCFLHKTEDFWRCPHWNLRYIYRYQVLSSGFYLLIFPHWKYPFILLFPMPHYHRFPLIRKYFALYYSRQFDSRSSLYYERYGSWALKFSSFQGYRTRFT